MATAASHAKRSSYRVESLGQGRVFVPKPAPPGEPCGTALVKPTRLLANDRGDVLVLGQACGEARHVVERWTGSAETSSVHSFDPSIRLRAAWLTDDGESWVGGGRAVGGYLARFDGQRWVEVPPPPDETISVALSMAGELWAVTEPSSKARGVSRVWVRGAGADVWEEVRVPSVERGNVVVGKPRWIESQGGAVWLGTDGALLVSAPDGFTLAQPPRRLAFRCSEPVTRAKPYTYRRATGPRPLQVRLHGDLVGTDCPHFFLVDQNERPESERWEGVKAAVEKEGLKAYVVPTVAFELGTYFFGFDGVELLGQYKARAFFKEAFPEIAEVCAEPLPIDPEQLTSGGVPPLSR